MAEGMKLALAAMMFYGLADLVFKHAAAKGVEAHHFLAFQSVFFTVGIFLYGLMTDTIFLGVPFLWGMLTGVLVFVALYNFARSLMSGAASIVVPIFRLSFTITTVLSLWFLREALTAWKLTGLAAALIAVWLLLAGNSASSPRATWPSVLQILVSSVVMGIVSFVYKLGTIAGGSPATLIAGQAVVYLPLAILFTLARGRGAKPPQGAWRYSAMAALLQLSALVMLISGLQQGEASILVPIAQLGFVVTSALGFIFLRERLTLRKVFGLAFAIASLVCLTRS